MERRLALATAGAVAATLGIATVCAAALGGGTLFGLAGDDSAAQIVPGASVEQVTRVVVVRSSDSSAVEPAASAVLEPAPSPTTATPPPTTTKVTTTTVKPATPTTVKPVTATSAAPVTTNAPTTNAPTTNAPTTVKPATPTTVRRPPGVPADWPADTPIPPMPAGCQDPQLELNGVWNCDD